MSYKCNEKVVEKGKRVRYNTKQKTKEEGTKKRMKLETLDTVRERERERATL